MDLRRPAVLLGTLVQLVTTAACHHGPTNGGCPVISSTVDISDEVCIVRGSCDDVYRRFEGFFGGATVGISDCGTTDGAGLFGSWPLDDAGADLFEWNAPVPVGGVFPSLNDLATPVQCTPADRCYPGAMTTIATQLTGFDAVKPEHDHVFIPLRGEAMIGGRFRARATVDDHTLGTPLRATVVAETSQGIQTFHSATGDTFAWGPYDASVIRMVEPHTGILEPIGWIEVRLAGQSPSPHVETR
jgi:hypothetical protein